MAGAVAITIAVTAMDARATSGVSQGIALVEALARGVIVGVPLAVAIYACRRRAHARFGRLLLVVSGLWFVAALSASSSSLLYSLGRVAGWMAETGLVYTLLAFPGGRLCARADRVLMAVSVALLTLLYLPTALLVERFPAPSQWASCSLGCPHNALMIVGSEPAFIDRWVIPLREGLTMVLFVLVAVRLAATIRDASPLLRRTLAPVLAAAIALLLAFVPALLARRFAPDSTLTTVCVWTLAFVLPAIALAFLVGLLRWHLFVTAGIRVVNARLREVPEPEQVREILAAAFEDPGLQVATWSGRRRRWIASDGQALAVPGVGSARWLSEVRDGGRWDVAILHDVALAEDSGFIEAAAAAASVAFASDRVGARVAGMVRELRASRARIAAAADDERRRIERDLHDGAQQRLVALYIHLGLAAETVDREHPQEGAVLRDLASEVEEALQEMRSLTHGIYPAMLSDRGLADAVRTAARRSAVPTRVEVEGLREYPQEIATAVYFCCVEALQNIAKHAGEARSARIVLRDADAALYFSVSDDGPGLINTNARVGAGMLNMRDRITTVGGQLAIHSRPGEGTRVNGRIPLSAVTPAGAPHDNRHSSRAASTTRRRDHSGP